MKELSIKVKKTVNAPIEQVFDAWFDPTKLAQFMMPMPNMQQPDITIDAKVGGKFEIIMHVGEDKLPHTGEYIAIDRPHSMCFSWLSAHSVSDSEVRLNFTPVNAGSTQVELTHVKFANEQARDDHHGGWTHILDLFSQQV
ncbi:MAG: SRPBCC family protein [Marinicella sp.]